MAQSLNPFGGRPSCSIRRTQTRCAVTLIEIVVGLVLLAMVLTSAVIAQKSHRQSVESARRIERVTAAADEVLSRLESQRGGFPRRSRGRFDGLPGYAWVNSPIRREMIAGVPVEVVRWQAIGPNNMTILSVDLVLDDPLSKLQIPGNGEEESAN